jgi:glycosyltransferase involved in cell wall biosynthesis
MIGLPSSDISAAKERIHVLFITDQLCESGGAERMLLKTIRLLPKDRFRCSLMTFKLDPSLELFQRLPCPTIVHPLRRTYDFGALRAFFAIRKFLREEDVSIIHTFHETSDLWAGFASKVGTNRILVSGRRDMGFQRSAKHDLGYRLMNPVFDLVLTVSEQVRRRCIERDGIASEKVATLYNGVELDSFERPQPSDLRSRLGLDLSSPLVITVGNIRHVKGIDVLIETAALVLRQRADVKFLVVGRISEPVYFEQLRQRIDQLGVHESVRFLGESERISSLLSECDIFFLPSRSEGFSNALIEAMASAIPCVATRVGGNAEAIEDGRNGYLVETEDPVVAAERIISLLQDCQFAKEMGNAAKRIVEEKFTVEVMIRELVKHYERLLMTREN